VKTFLALALAIAVSSPKAEIWNLDKSHSSVEFSVRHLVISSVKGQFDSFQISVTGDPAKPTTFAAKVTIPAASIDTRDAKRDEHLRSPDFFEVAKFPAVEFQSTKVISKGKQLVLVGNLTLHGVTKSVEIPFTVSGPVVDPWKNTRIGLEGSLVLNRKDYGINFSAVADNGGAVVSDEVTVSINYEGILQK